MKIFRSLKSVALLTVVFFSFSCVAPYSASAFHATQWSGGGQYGGSSDVGGPPNRGELPDPAKNNSTSCGDPVYLHSGEFYYECTDLVIPGRAGMDVAVKHLYRSGKAYNGQFGYGWTINYYYRLYAQNNGNVKIVSGDGRGEEYTYNAASNTYTPPPGFFEILVQNTDGSWTLSKAHGEQYHFDFEGKLASIEDRNGNAITFEYDTAGLMPNTGGIKFGLLGYPMVILVASYDYRLTRIIDTNGRAVDLTYDASGRLSQISDYAGRTVNYAYDSMTDDLLSITKPATSQFPSGRAKAFAYDGAHKVINITDAKGQTFVTNHYDGEGRVYQQDLGQGSYQFSYAANQTTVTDRKGNVTVYDLSAQGNVTRKEVFTSGLRGGDPASFITTYTYTNDMLLASVTYPNGNGILYNYDYANPDVKARGNLLSTRRKVNMALQHNDNYDLITPITYEPNFNFPKRIYDPYGRMTTLYYDYEFSPADPEYGTNGNLVRIEQPSVGGLMPTTNLLYDAYGQVTQMTDANGNVTQMTYEPATGYLSSVAKDPSGINAVTQYSYDTYGYLASVTDANNHTVNYAFDAAGWVNQITDALGHITKYTYDANGNVTTFERQANTSGTQWQATNFTYDILNNLKTVTDPLSRVTTYNYDNNENLASVVDAEMNTTSYVYDERDLLFTVTDANTPAGVTTYDYDPNGNLSRITDAAGNTTAYAYNLYDMHITTTYPDLSVSTFDYDKNYLMTRYTAPNGEAVDYVYDTLKRLTNKNFAANSTLNAAYSYDLGSRLTSANTAAANNAFTYDKLNRLASSTQALSGAARALNYTYDKAGNQTQVTYPSGKAVGYTFDANDRTDLVKVNGINLADYDYDVLDRQTTRTYLTGNQQQVVYQYDLANQLSSITNTVLPSANISSYSYPAYDAVGNRMRMDRTFGADPVQTINYNYNNIYELTSVTGAQTNSYAYDAVANRTTADGVNYTKNTLNQYNTVGGVSYGYDGNGNLTNDGNNVYTYDTENRLTSFTDGSNNASYTYDAFNRRVSKTVNGVTTYFVYDSDSVVAEYDSSNSLLAEYVLGDNIDEVLSMTRAGTDYYYHYDGLGSVTEIANLSGNVVESYTYDSFGNVSIFDASNQQRATSNILNPYMFTGRRWDSESGTYYYRARQYDPGIGRFLQRDPIGYYDSLNLYQYVGNNPGNWVDPYGLYAAVVIKLFKNGGRVVIKVLKDKASAVRARLAGLNVQAKTRQTASQIENAVAKGNPVIKHKGHDLPNGGKGRPHYQTEGLPGHTFWSGVGAFLLNLLDPFSPDVLANEDEDLDGNGIPDWRDEYNESQFESCPKK